MTAMTHRTSRAAAAGLLLLAAGCALDALNPGAISEDNLNT